jgi:hypothetical protein
METVKSDRVFVPDILPNGSSHDSQKQNYCCQGEFFHHRLLTETRRSMKQRNMRPRAMPEDLIVQGYSDVQSNEIGL